MIDAGQVLDVLDRLRAAGVRVWVAGGWGVDALVGEQTRAHDDLDLAVDARDQARAILAMEQAGFGIAAHHRPTQLVLRTAAGTEVDLHPVDFTVPGPGVQHVPGGTPYLYPADAFAAGTIAGRPAAILIPTGTQRTPGRRLPVTDWPPGLPPLAVGEVLGGGYICRTTRGRLADGREVVVKRCPYPAEVEADGLSALAAAGAPVPAVLGVGDHVLVLERVGGPPDWPALGRAIARLHRTTGDRFGWHRDNFQGMTRQHNGWSDDWPSFYVERRVRVHLADPRVPDPLRRRLERACRGPLPALLRARPPASLTHGDLWAANVVEGRWLVDPAVSFADRELELAYMDLSNSLPAELLAAYAQEWPPDPGYERRRPALQLHKFLNNIRHFGPDRYVPRIEAVLDGYGW